MCSLHLTRTQKSSFRSERRLQNKCISLLKVKLKQNNFLIYFSHVLMIRHSVVLLQKKFFEEKRKNVVRGRSRFLYSF